MNELMNILLLSTNEFALIYLQVENAIMDCRDMDDWTGQCQLMLKATHGMDYLEYYNFIKTIAKKRIACLQGIYTNVVEVKDRMEF